MVTILGRKDDWTDKLKNMYQEMLIKFSSFDDFIGMIPLGYIGFSNLIAQQFSRLNCQIKLPNPTNQFRNRAGRAQGICWWVQQLYFKGAQAVSPSLTQIHKVAKPDYLLLNSSDFASGIDALSRLNPEGLAGCVAAYDCSLAVCYESNKKLWVCLNTVDQVKSADCVIQSTCGYFTYPHLFSLVQFWWVHFHCPIK